MPTVELTEAPKLLLSPNANLAWWRIQILACSFYPAPKDALLRSKYADGILRSYAKNWTSRICILQPAGRAYHRWIALHGYALEQDEVAGLKANDERDLRISIAAAELLTGRSEHTSLDMNQSAIDSVSLAEKLRTRGESTVPTHGSSPILNPMKTWKVPEFFPLAAIDVVDCDGEILFQRPV